ncbi:hypothetical protein BBO99_00000691 [Phytophthora kernoviae]|uniref:Protein kinase domain-containing protein n=2 Tax=Phytophthora kernoviae TaxID=325452 RepID=A0A3R7KPA0_9STRA|nr:hypothetical protein G195_008543 [Phytophthora kernoviae 00238/432]KAG2528155.1 hypothetical protein JM16_003023 [Phytophthora kernoviae]KAG2529734.1 hypothetical protein JM18_002707 [Phytophthora kernoviae]RLN44831.1 hypothetical protein BBI17_002830 [Phytophthora kernoviae]RLN85243.1 hypothetical protein BBO99_00000691 [Phytophthora kernoviae]
MQGFEDGFGSKAFSALLAPLGFKVKAWLENYMEDGETRLFPNDIKSVWGSTIGSSLTANWKALPVVCDGQPSVQTKSSTLTPNGGCPDVYTNASVSCTCLEGYDNSTDWEFYIEPRQELTDQPLTLEFGATIGVTSIVTIVTPDDVTSIKIVGVGQDAVTLNVTAEATGWDNYDTSNPSLIEVATTTVLEKITLENVDLFTALDATTDYIPLAIQNLTLRYCNISTVTSTFLQGFASLEYLDLSHNKLHGTYARISSQMCTANPCPMKSINVSNNGLTQIPYRMFYLNQLNSLYLINNAIENWTVSSDLYDNIAGLTNFDMDAPNDSYTCDNGTWKTAHGVDFCVLDSTTASASSESSSSSNTYLIYVIVAACVVVGVLIFVFIRNRRARNRRKERDEAVFDHTLSFDSHFTANTNIINDPLIIAHRIPFKDVKVANCINKGGFGLVYSGVYNRRRVAIKRIRSDLCQDMKHVEAFMKEICLISTLDHPRIVEFIGVAWDTLRNLSAVTEYMERGDLREVLQSFHLRNTPLTWNEHKLLIAQHIAEALTYLHSLDPKLIHRDLKSKNVLLNTEMEAKLSDFGVSRERHAMETHMTAGIGTSFWIAPEVLLGKDYDERADIFSLGIVISEIDTEDYPYWNAKNPPQGGKVEETAILRMVATGELIPDFTEGCPKRILELAKACLALNPDDRPSATEVVYTIQQIMGRSSVSYGSPSLASSNSSRPPMSL